MFVCILHSNVNEADALKCYFCPSVLSVKHSLQENGTKRKQLDYQAWFILLMYLHSVLILHVFCFVLLFFFPAHMKNKNVLSSIVVNKWLAHLTSIVYGREDEGRNGNLGITYISNAAINIAIIFLNTKLLFLIFFLYVQHILKNILIFLSPWVYFHKITPHYYYYGLHI